MRFPLFNIQKHLSDKHSKVAQVLSKFNSLQEASFNILITANNYYDAIPASFIGLSGKNLDQYRQEMISSATEFNSEEFHQASELYKQDLSKKRRYHWHVEQKNRLQDNKLWKQFEQNCKTPSQLSRLVVLKKHWAKHARFSPYTSDALIEAAKVLSLFKHYQALLTEEFDYYKHDLPIAIRYEINAYLRDLQLEITREKQELCEAMVARLKLASDSGDVNYDDVTVSLAQALKEMHLLKEHFVLPQHPRNDLSQARRFFQDFILQHGGREQRRSVEQLSWFKSDEHYRIQNNSKGIKVYPKSLERYLNKARFIDRLLGMTSLTQKLMDQNQEFIIQLRFPPDPHLHFETLTNFYSNEKWHHLIGLSQKIVSEYESANTLKPTRLLSKLFQRSKTLFINRWQAYLRDQQQALLNRMLTYASFVTSQLKTRLDLELDQELLCSKPFQQDINRFKEDLLAAISRAGLNSNDISEYGEFDKLYEKVIHLPLKLEKIRLAKLQISEMSRADVANESCEDNANAQSIDERNPFKPHHVQDQLKQLEEFLKELLPVKGCFVLNAALKKSIATLNHFLQAFPCEEVLLQQPHPLLELTLELCRAYIMTWIWADESHKEPLAANLAGLETLLNTLAPVYIKTALAELITLREQQNWFVFQAKCHGLLVSLGASEEETQDHLKTLVKKLSTHDTTSKPTQSTITCSSASFFNHNPVQRVPSEKPDDVVLSY